MDSNLSDASATQDLDFLVKNLPNCTDMLTLTLPHQDIFYYPISSGQTTQLKPFDFLTQHNINEDDDFVSIDTKTATNSKTKSKQIKKQNQSSSKAAKPVLKNQNYYQPPTQKFKVSQSITPESSWKILADFNKLILEKLHLDAEAQITVETEKVLGTLYQPIEEIQEKVSSFNPLTWTKYENMKFFGTYTTTDDDFMKTNTDIANIFVTDKILSVLMTCVYNCHPWHLKITKLGDNIYFDKMESSEVDYVTVNESDNTPSDEDDKNINGYQRLAIEATWINEFIKEQILDKTTDILDVDGENPYIEEDMDKNDIEHSGYVYRIWNIDDMKVLVRCQVHSYEVNDDNQVEFVNIYALNEYDKNTYLSKESNAWGMLLKKEWQNNHLKWAKWGVNCYLAGVKKMKMGFVTRKNVKENKEHLITGFYDLNCEDLLKVTNFNKNIAWAILKEVITVIERQKADGTFIIMKTLGATGAKSMLKLYKVTEKD